jgi:AcrR family transcriptional regulator
MINRPRSSGRRPAATHPEPTRARILDAAERLFAERGIEAASVRSILAAAGVNPALAHYHFGSRDGLVAELLRARVGPLAEELLRAVEEADARGDQATLEDVLRAYFTPAARCMVEQPRIGRLLAQLQSSPSAEVQAMGRDALRAVFTRLGEAVVRRLPPGAEPRQVFLRFYLVVGGPAFLAGNWDYIARSARRHLGAAGAMDDAAWIAEELVTSSAAVLRGRG